MALVILPSDLPYWHSLQKQLTLTGTARNSKDLLDGMIKIHNMCNTGLDPDEPDKADPKIFDELGKHLESLSDESRDNFYSKTLPIMVRRALDLKVLKPIDGLKFSLQQQGDRIELQRNFVASLLAHSFFSTFPKRTPKTHPTLQDFNFTHFFKYLDSNSQKAKLESILHYFEVMESEEISDNDDVIVITRQVLTGRHWLTIEDWIESNIPLCPLTIRHDGRLHEAESQCLRVCFSSQKLGGSILSDGTSQECIDFSTIPELITILSSVESLEDNEALLISNVYQVTTISEPRQRANVTKLQTPKSVSICCMDPENYTRLPVSQLEEDNLLRELNKALIGFNQGKELAVLQKRVKQYKNVIQRRLSPIGESFSSTPSEYKSDGSPPTSPTKKTDSPSRRAAWLRPASPEKMTGPQNRRGKFIVLGSSKECLPVSRQQAFQAGRRTSDVLKSEESVMKTTTAGQWSRPRLSADSMYSSAQSEDDNDDDEDEEVFHSARTSVDREDGSFRDCTKNDDIQQRSQTFDIMNSYSIENFECRSSFAQKLRDALLRGATTFSSDDDSSYAVGISVSGSDIADYDNIRFRRETSTGFMLQDSLDDGFYQDSIEHEQVESDKNSLTSDCSSNLEEMYDKFAKWLNSTNRKFQNDEANTADAVRELTSCLLKRALSDGSVPNKKAVNMYTQDGEKVILAAKSFSLELSRQKPKLAAKLVNLLTGAKLDAGAESNQSNGTRAVATGNWGCGSNHGGDAQFKLAIQWLAASYAGLPNLIYYTCRHHKLLKLDTVRRILLDRGWTVGELVTSLLKHAESSINDPQSSNHLFDLLISSNQNH